MNFLRNRSVFFMAGAVVLLLVFIVGCWWLLKPNYVPLLQQDNKIIQADAINALNNANIPYSIKNNSIQVDESRLGAARIALDQAGLSNPDTVGFELFNQTDYGMSDFAQKINFQRAVEGEVARSIMAMDGIKYARVHITPTNDALYAADKTPAKASVVIQTLDGYHLPKDSIEGVQRLVASAVEDLTPENVALLNEQGEVISSDLYDASGALGRESDLALEIETKVKQILQQSFNISQSSVSARVQVNYDKKKVVREKPILADEGLLILKKKETTSFDSSADSANATHKNDSKDNEYAIGKETSEVEYASGTVSKISVGVIVPNTLSYDQLQNIQTALEAGLGIDRKRGDTLVLVSSLMPVNSTVAIAPVKKAQLATVELQSWKNYFNPLSIGLMVLLGLIAIFWLIKSLTSRRVSPHIKPRALSAEEREQVVVNLKYWLSRE